MDSYIPLLGYRNAASTDEYQREEERDTESRTRHWALVWWDEGENGRCTAEFMVVTETMPDFCGGIIVYSPRVEIYREKGGWQSSFCAPGYVSHITDENGEEGTPLKMEWTEFDESMALNLAAFTGKTDWNEESVREYGLKCIAAAVGGLMLGSGRRGFMGVDRTDGRLTELVLEMGSMGEFVPFPTHNLNPRKIHDNLAAMQPMSVQTMYTNNVVSFEISFAPEWNNPNSGNACHWLTGMCRPTVIPLEEGQSTMVECYECGTDFDSDDYDGECPECGYMNEARMKSSVVNLSRKVGEVLGSVDYRRRAKRFYWRNG